MIEVHSDAVRAALSTVIDPATGLDVLASGLIKGLTVRDGRVSFVIEAAPARAAALEAVRAAAETAVRGVPGVTQVTAVLTAHAGPGEAAPPRSPRVQAAQRAKGADATQRAKGADAPGSASSRLALPDVGKVIAVASGKGGVGKSTTAANLACAFAAKGLSVGLLDADVFGPSVPILFGVEGQRPRVSPDHRLEPIRAFGVKLMSIGFLVSTDQAMIWRGPMVMSAINQMLSDVAWAPLDVLVIDCPPGTGDALLTLAQRAPIDGAIVVSTPQKVALADVRRGVELFRKTRIPVLGVVENMSGLTGSTAAPFGRGGAQAAARELAAPFLGALPIDPRLCEMSDAGTPPAAVEPEGELGRAFAALAEAALKALSDEARPAPRINFV